MGGGGAGAYRKKQDANVFGCIFGCISSPINNYGDPQGSLEPVIGGGIEICDSKPEPTSCPVPKEGGCGPYDPNCDNTFQPPGPPLPLRMGYIVGASMKRDGRICVRLGLFVELPLPSYELGSVYEH
jgi:hypothetical protein